MSDKDKDRVKVVIALVVLALCIWLGWHCEQWRNEQIADRVIEKLREGGGK